GLPPEHRRAAGHQLRRARAARVHRPAPGRTGRALRPIDRLRRAARLAGSAAAPALVMPAAGALRVAGEALAAAAAEGEADDEPHCESSKPILISHEEFHTK